MTTQTWGRPRPAVRLTNVPTDPLALLDVVDAMNLHRLHYAEALQMLKDAGAFRLGRRFVIRRGDLDKHIESLAAGAALMGTKYVQHSDSGWIYDLKTHERTHGRWGYTTCMVEDCEEAATFRWSEHRPDISPVDGEVAILIYICDRHSPWDGVGYTAPPEAVQGAV